MIHEQHTYRCLPSRLLDVLKRLTNRTLPIWA
jgi:hypothetical protein